VHWAALCPATNLDRLFVVVTLGYESTYVSMKLVHFQESPILPWRQAGAIHGIASVNSLAKLSFSM